MFKEGVKMKKLIVIPAIMSILALGGCTREWNDVRNEHNGVTCVYDMRKNDWTGEVYREKLIACGPTETTTTTISK